MDHAPGSSPAPLPGPDNGSWTPPPASDLQRKLPQYEITDLVGKGGMGAVYKGRQLSLDRPVAVKILPATLVDADSGFAGRFKHEARAMAKLSHPGIVGVHAFGQTEDGLLYLVMEFVEGTDVAHLIAEQGFLPPEHAHAIAAHVCDALAYAHEQGVIHRDIKPSNIMISVDGAVKVADFGLAKAARDGDSGMMLGTPGCIAPEALTLDTAVDHRADIYAVGVMLHQMLTGDLPRGIFEPPSMKMPGVDSRFDAIVAKALREDRNLRYQSAREMRADLDLMLTQPAAQEPPREPAASEAHAPPARSQASVPAPQRRTPVTRQPQRAASTGATKKTSVAPWVALLLIGGGASAWFLTNHRPDKSSSSAATAEKTADASLVVASTAKAPEVSPSSPVTGAPAAQTSGAPGASKLPAVKPGPPPKDMVTVIAATKDKPFVNSMGMKLMPVPITGGPTNGKRVLFGIWETRVQDYEPFARETGRQWPAPPYRQGPTHPAVNMTWKDAQAFCDWLTARERDAGWISSEEMYRLPSDHEWSCAVGIGEREDASKPATEKHLKMLDVYPWGSGYPPPPGAGNYNGEESAERDFSHSFKPLTGYRDPFPAMAAVGSFAANPSGLFDMGGNAWEFCVDPNDKSGPVAVIRGATFLNSPARELLSSWHSVFKDENARDKDKGFRVVLDASRQKDVPAGAALPELAVLQQQFEKLKAERVTSVFEADLAKLNASYAAGLDREMQKERAAGRLDSVLALEDEKRLVSEKKPVPPKDDAKTIEAVKRLRVIYREAKAKLDATRDAGRKVLVDPLVAHLTTLEADLEEKKRPADAKAVREYRKVILARRDDPEVAARLGASFTNSLGMKFMPLPGTNVFMCIHETRRKDYAQFATAMPSVSGYWKGIKHNNQPVGGEDDHPAAGVSWLDAADFCAWLGKKEGRTYRLPSDREWSVAAGIADQESSTAPPSALSNKLANLYPWGSEWPPPKNAGNFGDTSFKEKGEPGNVGLESYTDGFSTTAPVMSFPANKLGIHDLSGNIWEWCEDWFDDKRGNRLMRGGSWMTSSQGWLLSSQRRSYSPDAHYRDFGFRVVVVDAEENLAGSDMTAPAAADAAGAPGSGEGLERFTNSLGMKFVILPGTKVFMCIHETRKGDYAAFANATPGLNSTWRIQRNEFGAAISPADDHPVVNVVLDEAVAFCQWLGRKEGKTYRLPTDREWSNAVGIAKREGTLGSPQTKHGKLPGVFPWGDVWPPPPDSGNFGDVTFASQGKDMKGIRGYTDGFATTAPVMSFKPNALGIYDLGGNVWELIGDDYSATKKHPFLRGGSFTFSDRLWLGSSARDPWSKDGRLNSVGFRVVAELPNP